MAFPTATFPEILDDLSSRFIINVPEEELASVERICFQIEQAHWFYEDFVREQNPNLPSFTLKNFSAKFFQHCPLLHQWSHEHEKAFSDFMQYKIRIPVCGAIMLNGTMELCVLVKGWSSRSGWGFPKGKINKDEPDSICAAREVLEETGYDISPLIKENDYVEITIREQRIRLYIVVGVSEDTEFCPRTRKEISKIEWHKLSELPTWIRSKDKDSPYHCGGGCVKYGSSRFYMVVPFVSKLRNWVKLQKKLARKRPLEINNQEESPGAMAINGQASETLVSIVFEGEKTSSEASVPGTESEGSAKGQSPIPNDEPQRGLTDSNETAAKNLLKSILGVEDQTVPYLVDGPPPVPPSQVLPLFSPMAMQAPSIDRDITAPIPRSANNNVNIAALDPEQQLRRNSIFKLFTESTPSGSRRPSGNTVSSSSVSIDNDERRRNSLLGLLQPEVETAPLEKTPIPRKMERSVMGNSVIPAKRNVLGSDNSSENQERMLHFLQHPSLPMSQNKNNNSLFSMFSQPMSQPNPIPPYHHHTTDGESRMFLGNRHDSMFSLYSTQGYITSMASQHFGFVGQGRPPNRHHDYNNIHGLDHTSREIDDISRKISLLGLLSSDHQSENFRSTPSLNHRGFINGAVNNHFPPISSSYFSNGMETINQTLTSSQQSYTPSSPNVLRASQENLLRLITASPPPQAKFATGPIGAEIQEQERVLMRFLKFASGDNDTNDNDTSATASIDSGGSSTTTIANELNADLDGSGIDAINLNRVADIVSDPNVSSTGIGKNSGFMDPLSYLTTNTNFPNESDFRMETTNAERGGCDGPMLAGTIELTGLPPDPRHIPGFLSSAPRVINEETYNPQVPSHQMENVFLNFKFDVDKILAAM